MVMLNGLSLLAIYFVSAWGTPRIVSVPDLHGDYERAMQVLQAAGVIDTAGTWVGGTTTLVQTGDIADRGAGSLKIYRLFDRLAKDAPKTGGRVVNLLGNHELMNMQGDDRYVSKLDMEGYGGRSAWQQTWQADGEIGKLVRTFKAAAKVGNLLFVHAGLLPTFLAGGRTLDDLNSDMISALSRSNLRGNSKLLGDSGPLWTRYYAEGDDPSICASVQEVLKHVGAIRMIVGHTIQQRSQGEYRANPVCSGSLILGDTAISRAYGGEMSFIEYKADDSAVVNYPGLDGVKEVLPPSPLSVPASLHELAKTRVQDDTATVQNMRREAGTIAAEAPTSSEAYPTLITGRFGLACLSAFVLAGLALCTWVSRSPFSSSRKLRNP